MPGSPIIMGDRPTVFICYSRADRVWKDQLVKHLGVLERQGLIDVWDDSRIAAGANWKNEIDDAMTRAHVAVLLVTADFLNSEFVLGEEVPRLLERRQSEGLVIYPILVKPCVWNAVDWLAALQMRPGGRALSRGSEHEIDEDLTAFAKEVREILAKPSPSGATARSKASTTRERLLSLVSDVQSRATPLSVCIAAAIPIALELKDEDMRLFCERELTGYEQRKLSTFSRILSLFTKINGVESILGEKRREAVEHRVVEFHVAKSGVQLNMDYFEFDSASSIMGFIARNPDKFTTVGVVYPPPIARIEKDITQFNVKTILDLSLRNQHYYAPASSLNGLIERIRARFTAHLLRNVRQTS